MLGFRPLFVVLLALPAAAYAASRVQAAPVPAEMRSTAFTVTVNGQTVEASAGDVVCFPSQLEHAAVMLDEEVILLDIFTPVREDFLPRGDAPR